MNVNKNSNKMESFCQHIDAINNVVGKYTSILIIPLTCLVLADVLLRYIVNQPIKWAWDVNIQLLGAMTMLGAGYALIDNGHVNIDSITTHLSRRSRAILDVITSIFFFFGIVVLLWQTVAGAWDSLLIKETYTSVFMLPIYPYKILMIFGVALLLLQGIAKFIRDLAIVLQVGDK